MVNFNAETPPNVIRVPRWTLALHVIQFVFAIIILGLDAYGIKWIPYNALIFSLVACLCTLFVTIYLLVSQLFIHKIYYGVVALAFHVWMLIFWVVDLGLVANLAHLWSGPQCSYSYYYGYNCSYYVKRGVLQARDETTFTAYYGALVAGAVFAAVQLVTWAICAAMLFLHFNKHRANTTTHATGSVAPPQYASTNHPHGGNNTISQPIPMEKYNNQPGPNHQTSQPQYAQPVPQHQHQQQQYPTAPYAQDPVQRQGTVSPVSQAAGYVSQPPNPNTSELHSPPHTGAHHPNGLSSQPSGAVYNPNVSELSTSQQHTGPGHYDHNVSELSTR